MDAVLTFDKAIELLEISNISRISINEILELKRRARKRWHPDKVAHLKDPEITKEYTLKFQQIEDACQLVSAYINGTYQAGEAFSSTNRHHSIYEEPEEVIRKNANNIQNTLKALWGFIRERK